MILTKSQSDKLVYFRGLNAFRFIAASLVVFTHIEGIKESLNINQFYFFKIESVGALSVTFFFVLSGFLITYLLLVEMNKIGSISVKKFYWRRILRIWPLYYLILFIAFFIINNSAISGYDIANSEVYKNAPWNFIMYIIFLPNVAWWLSLAIPFASQLWSVGVEEQFYLFWPLVVRRFSKRDLLFFMILFISLFSIMRIMLTIASLYVHQAEYVANILSITRIDCMVVGGIGGYGIYYNYKKIISRFNRWFDLIAVCVALILVLSNYKIPFVHEPVCSFVFLYIIISASCFENSLLTMENKIWSWLGKLSYGIYMWHTIVLAVLFCMIKKMSIAKDIEINLLLYLSTLPLTILVSWISYVYIESPFLKIKEEFVLIKSKSA